MGSGGASREEVEREHASRHALMNLQECFPLAERHGSAGDVNAAVAPRRRPSSSSIAHSRRSASIQRSSSTLTCCASVRQRSNVAAGIGPTASDPSLACTLSARRSRSTSSNSDNTTSTSITETRARLSAPCSASLSSASAARRRVARCSTEIWRSFMCSPCSRGSKPPLARHPAQSPTENVDQVDMPLTPSAPGAKHARHAQSLWSIRGCPDSCRSARPAQRR